jgi:hypothetical protein
MVLALSIFTPFLAKIGVKMAQLFLLPGVIFILVLGGNVHSGLGADWLDYAVGTTGTFVFWMTSSSIVVWIVTKRPNGHK